MMQHHFSVGALQSELSVARRAVSQTLRISLYRRRDISCRLFEHQFRLES